MKLGRLREITAKMDDNLEIFIRNSVNPCGNIQNLDQAELAYYSSFGVAMPCLILNTSNSKELEEDENEETIDYLEDD